MHSDVYSILILSFLCHQVIKETFFLTKKHTCAVLEVKLIQFEITVFTKADAGKNDI